MKSTTSDKNACINLRSIMHLLNVMNSDPPWSSTRSFSLLKLFCYSLVDYLSGYVVMNIFTPCYLMKKVKHCLIKWVKLPCGYVSGRSIAKISLHFTSLCSVTAQQRFSGTATAEEHEENVKPTTLCANAFIQKFHQSHLASRPAYGMPDILYWRYSAQRLFLLSEWLKMFYFTYFSTADCSTCVIVQA